MIYRLRHVTVYRYGSPVTFAQCTLTLIPPSNREQTADAVSISIDPKPKSLTEHRSFFGHAVMIAEINVSHRELRIEADAIVEVDRVGHTDLMPDLAWEEVRRVALGWAGLEASGPAHFLFPSPRVELSEAVTAYARESFTAGRPIIEAGVDLMRRIRKDFRYAPDATRVSTPLIEAFDKRHGVCQDFAHIMIAGLRGLGMPVRYVSGYIRTVPPAGRERLEGADATHAWVDLWCGPDHEWIGLDPTNAIRVGNDHIVLANGRDYSDVAPVGGILLGASDQVVQVGVDVVPLDRRPNSTR